MTPYQAYIWSLTPRIKVKVTQGPYTGELCYRWTLWWSQPKEDRNNYMKWLFNKNGWDNVEEWIKCTPIEK